MGIIADLLGRTDEMIWIEPDPVMSELIAGYFERRTDRKQIGEAVIKRYGTGIKVTKDPAGNKLEQYAQGAFSEMVLSGAVEINSVGFGHSVSSTLATLFTEHGQRFALVPETEGQDVKDAQKYFEDLRALGGFRPALVSADLKACQGASSFLLVTWSEGHPVYRALPVGRIKVGFYKSVTSEGQTRAANFADLGDAAVIVIETGSVDNRSKSYLAVFSESVNWPKGRWVSYLSNAGGKDIPAVNSKDSWDFFDPDAPKEAANPLVLYAWDHPDRDCPEFPVVIFRHGLIGGDNLFPQSGSLHSESVEADVAASHLRSTSQDAARGTLVLTRTHDARTSPVPRSLKGVCDLQPGQGLKHEGHDPGASLTGWQVLKGELALAGTGYGCPDFLTVPEDHTLDASSGTALKVKTIPLKKVREYRAEVNTGSVRDLFAIERSLLWIFGDNDPVSDGLIKVIDTCGQSWDPGEFELPENNKETGDLVLSLLDAGVIDTIEAIRRENKLSTDDEAIALYERMKARIEQYPPLKKEPEPPTVPGFQNITKPAVIKPEK